ncbi:interactor of constitutive active ROPs 4-like [Actinidia eriantha]|uniref:interactor of constitutive active ROPs 4-like n=1 Tax=Actinidia eriantha TaxID=165200 RepID=UPI00258E0C8D|nr:interactor of constitutive active ROPs 4-like [Actinidia eriantha]XP_057465319.1 interactor of constitutive active ROPs 4-like [Actinidia eriantha]XP_057465320.1 interactor of constitutive active ROPs 4-like [Actinidia eriantha]
MPRSRGSEMPQRQSPRGLLHLRTSSSDSDSLHHRSIPDKSPKLGDRRSPRGAQSDPPNPKKLGTRIADLESQLGQAQEELKLLKDQLASAEAEKKEAQEQLEKKARKPSAPNQVEVQEMNKRDTPHEIPDYNQRETDVFEVPLEPKIEFSQPIEQQVLETKSMSISNESPEPQMPTFDDLALKEDEINSLKSSLEEKEKELEVFRQENESLKGQLNEAALEASKGRAREEEMTSTLSQMGQELEASRANEAELKEKLEAVEGAKEALEAEMKKLRVQTEQWRKAADAAAAVLSGGVEMSGRRISERCGSMDKHFGGIFEPSVGGYAGYVGSPGLGDDSDNGFGNGKRKGSGIRMFGDLWKKKGNK